ncbi:MAG: hypothetical protein ABIR70_21495 [Bryobacteraceae bacterium]
MKLFLSLALVGIAWTGVVRAQATPPVAGSGSVTVTGCIEKSTTEEYSLTSQDGKKYELRTINNEIKLADHVGHRVTVTAAGPRAGTNVPSTERVSLDVIALAMVSQSCATK